MNNLKSEKSSYLKSAVHQPVNWYPWCAEAFEKAKEKDMPVLLDIGAVWCHWCHVMDGESYEDEETASIINENYIAIKVDKDERPDIDSRYQKAVSIFSGTGGWPLTAFLTYEGYFFYGGTYFPKESNYGLPSYKSVLTEIAKYYKQNREAVFVQSGEFYLRISDESGKFSIFNINIKRINDAIKRDNSLNIDYVKRFVNEGALEFKLHFDGENGGIEESPKFFYFSALELLAWDYIANRDKDSFNKGILTLNKIACGGVFDHVGGGFHRYSTDKKWIIPHFEKLADINAQALKVYSYYYRLTGNRVLLNIINKTLDFITGDLYDSVSGGFYASIDADTGDNDDGRFFTWTYNELREVFPNGQEFKAAAELLNINKEGRMWHAQDENPAFGNFLNNGFEAGDIPNVLYIGAYAEALNGKLYNSVMLRLKTYRDKRKKPFTDKNKYSSVNGNIIYSITELSKFFSPFDANRQKLNGIAEKSIKIFLDIFDKNGDIGRFTAESGGSVLDDNAYIILALIGLFETTSKPLYFIYAKKIAEYVIKNYYDGEKGGFFDIKHTTKSSKIGFLNHKEKNIADYGGYSQNASILLAMSKLHMLTEEAQFKNVILKSFEYFINEANMLKYNASGYLISLIYYTLGANANIVAGKYGDKAISDFFNIANNSNNNKLKVSFNSFNIFIDTNDKDLAESYSGFEEYGKGDALILEKIRNAIVEYGRVKKPLVLECGDRSCNVRIL
ncbi:MAG: thioredoxin domain-containing protein [bacterium]